jgi:hypothetical protein
MAEHFTWENVFKRGAQLNTQVLGFADRQRQGIADMELQSERLRINRESTRFLQELEQDGDFDNYLKKWSEFRNDYNIGVNDRDDLNPKLRKSKYFFREMDRILKEGYDNIEAQVRGRQFAAQHAAGRALLNKNLREAREMYAYDPQTYINVAHQLISPAVKNGYISYAESLQFKDSAFRAALEDEIERQVWGQWQQGKTIDDLDEIFKGIDLSGFTEFSFSPIKNESNKAYADTLQKKPNLNKNEAAWLRAYEGRSEDDARYAQELLAKENLTGEEEAWIAGFQGRSENDTEGYEEKLVINPQRIEAVKKSKMDWARQNWNTYVTGKRKETASQLSSTYGKVLTAVTLGDQNAVEYIRAGLNEVASFSNLFIDPDDRNKYNKWYNDLLKEITKSPKDAGKKAVELMLTDMMPSFIQAGLQGYFSNPNSPITMYDAKDAFKKAVHAELKDNYGYSGRASDVERDFPIISTFLDEAKKAMKKLEYSGFVQAIDDIESYVEASFKDNKARFNKLYRDRKEDLINTATERAYDIMFSSVLKGTNGSKVAEDTKKFINTLVAVDLDLLRINPETGKSNFERKMFETENEPFAQAVYALSRPDAVWTDLRGQRRYNGIEQSIAEEIIYEAMPARLINELRKKGIDVSADDILPPQFTKTEGGRDEDGVIEYRLKNDPNTKYRFTASKDGKKFDWKLEQSDASGGWTTVTSPQTQKQEMKEAKAEQREAEERMNFISTVSVGAGNIKPPENIKPEVWQRMSATVRQQFIQNLKATDPRAYEEWEESLFSNPPYMARGMKNWNTLSREERESIWKTSFLSGRR